MVRPEGWGQPAGRSPVRVGIGAPVAGSDCCASDLGETTCDEGPGLPLGCGSLFTRIDLVAPEELPVQWEQWDIR